MWYVMSYNTIQGFCNGAFDDIGMLFLAQGQDDPQSIGWTPLLSEAMQFPTNAVAREHVERLWGHYTMLFGYLKFDPDSLREASETHAREQLDIRRAMSARLASKQITKEELLEASKSVWKNNALTYREKWIIEIMNQDRKSL